MSSPVELDVRGTVDAFVHDFNPLMLAPRVCTVAVAGGFYLEPDPVPGRYVGELVDERVLPPPTCCVHVSDVEDSAIDPDPGMRP